MSSQSKRRAESVEVAHKKKPRKGGEEDNLNQDEVDGLEVEDDEVSALDKENIIHTDRRTRGKRVDYAKVDLSDDNGFEAAEEVLSKEKKGAPAAGPQPENGSPQRELAGEIIEEDEDDDDDEEEEYGDDGDDDGTDEEEEEEE